MSILITFLAICGTHIALWNAKCETTVVGWLIYLRNITAVYFSLYALLVFIYLKVIL